MALCFLSMLPAHWPLFTHTTVLLAASKWLERVADGLPSYRSSCHHQKACMVVAASFRPICNLSHAQEHVYALTLLSLLQCPRHFEHLPLCCAATLYLPLPCWSYVSYPFCWRKLMPGYPAQGLPPVFAMITGPSLTHPYRYGFEASSCMLTLLLCHRMEEVELVLGRNTFRHCDAGALSILPWGVGARGASLPSSCAFNGSLPCTYICCRRPHW
jgi:hypothetical protein